MENKIYCSCCKRMESGPAVKAPGPRLGSIVVDQLVCSGCQACHSDNMENEFWRGADCSDKTKCPKCSNGLTSQNGMPVYRKVKDDGSWDVVIICATCHIQYRNCCWLAK